MNKLFKKVLAVDGSYLIHRQLHNSNLFELRGPNGERSGAVFGFLRSIVKELRINGEYFPVVCWDAGLSPRRVKADPYYKHADERSKPMEVLTEEEADNDYLTQYRKQRSMIIELLNYAGIPSLRFRPWEGDDLIYILTRISEECRVLTDDRDMLQLLSDTVSVRRPMADELITYESFLSDHDFSDSYDFVMYKAIIGDGSDNIPGCCKGVGSGTVGNLIKFLKYIKYDFSKLKSESEARTLFKESGIKFRSAYLNFDESRFRTNLELVDLNRVIIDQYVLESIISSIDNCRSNVDYFAFVKLLGHIGIREISADELIHSVSEKYKFLK